MWLTKDKREKIEANVHVRLKFATRNLGNTNSVLKWGYALWVFVLIFFISYKALHYYQFFVCLVKERGVEDELQSWLLWKTESTFTSYNFMWLLYGRFALSRAREWKLMYAREMFESKPMLLQKSQWQYLLCILVFFIYCKRGATNLCHFLCWKKCYVFLSRTKSYLLQQNAGLVDQLCHYECKILDNSS